MERLRVEGTVISKKESAVKEGVFYVTVETEGWGTVKFASTRKGLKEGDRVVLTDQKYRNQADKIQWQEARR